MLTHLPQLSDLQTCILEEQISLDETQAAVNIACLSINRQALTESVLNFTSDTKV